MDPPTAPAVGQRHSHLTVAEKGTGTTREGTEKAPGDAAQGSPGQGLSSRQHTGAPSLQYVAPYDMQGVRAKEYQKWSQRQVLLVKDSI